MTELYHGLFFFLCASVATGSWLGGAYSIYRGLQALPDGQRDVPFLSTDPRLITAEGLKWRTRIYWSALYFVTAVVFFALYKGMH
jgi:hypothetical protein